MQLSECHFTNGTTRPGCRNNDGRKCVPDDRGEPVYAIWLHSDEYQVPIV